MDQKRIAIIRLKGEGNVRPPVRETLRLLRLYKKQTCVIIPNTPQFVGMLMVVKDYITWGEVDEETMKQLLVKRGRLARKKMLTDAYVKEQIKMDIPAFVKEFIAFKKELKDIPALKLFFNLAPPRKGLEAKGVKADFSMGGALGYRKSHINELIQRML
ncbi:MAG: 50S ribosomal protein L30 [Nanoarchaeota archaeon]|nr:50S ribosomal protein L30 [Nanoarchaeota archaeon]